MPFLGGTRKDLPLLSSVSVRGAWGRGVWGSMCGILYVHVPRLLLFEYKHAGEVTACRNPVKTLYSGPLLACFMDACLIAGSFRGWRTMTTTRREAAPGSRVLG